MSGSNKPRTVLITGGSAGIGLAAAQAFSDAGDTVYSLSRSAPPDARVRHIACDVTDAAGCQSAVAQAAREAGGIDVVLLNAGYGISGPAEFTQLAHAQRQFDVNFFGALRVLQPALPYLRASRGLVLLTSSVAAAVPIPYQSFYSAVKAAVSAFALALRSELAPHGVRVCAVLPGDVKTGFTGARVKSGCVGDVYPRAQRAVATMERDEENGMPPARIAAQFVRLSHQKNPKPLSTVGLPYRLVLLLARLLPARLCCRIVGRIYG